MNSPAPQTNLVVTASKCPSVRPSASVPLPFSSALTHSQLAFPAFSPPSFFPSRGALRSPHSIALARIRPARPQQGARHRRRGKADEGAKTSERRIGLPSSVVAVGGNGGTSSRRTRIRTDRRRAPGFRFQGAAAVWLGWKSEMVSILKEEFHMNLRLEGGSICLLSCSRSPTRAHSK